MEKLTRLFAATVGKHLHMALICRSWSISVLAVLFTDLSFESLFIIYQHSKWFYIRRWCSICSRDSHNATINEMSPSTCDYPWEFRFSRFQRSYVGWHPVWDTADYLGHLVCNKPAGSHLSSPRLRIMASSLTHRSQVPSVDRRSTDWANISNPWHLFVIHR